MDFEIESPVIGFDREDLNSDGKPNVTLDPAPNVDYIQVQETLSATTESEI